MPISEEISTLVEERTYIGLTSTEAEIQEKKFGLNRRPSFRKESSIRRLFNILMEPMMLLLFVTAIVYYFIGDKLDTIILLLSIIPICIIEFLQERRTDQAIAMLDKLLTEFCMVYRNGVLVKKEIVELVPRDLVYLNAGDKIPADGYLLKTPGLQVDEAILTGESISVTKSQVGNSITDECRVFQGTLVVQGEGYMVVEMTGEQTAYGKLGGLLEKIKQEKTPLQKKIHDLVRVVAFCAVAAAVLVGAIISVRNGIVPGILGGLTMAMSLIPEEFPVVFSVFLIMGVWRMTKQKALIRRMTMVEVLGSTTVICTDKTGTLTEGAMSLAYIYTQSKQYSLVDEKRHADIFKSFIQDSLFSLEQVAVDPIECEVQRFAQQIGIPTRQLYDSNTLVTDSPFSSKTKVVSHVWKHGNGEVVQYTAGAPESVTKFCKLSEKDSQEIQQALENLFLQGYRVIAIAKRPSEDATVVLGDLEFVGLLAMSDPPRVGVKEAIEMCQDAGIRIVMITGDNKLTAHTIAEDIHLNHHEEILSGSDLEKLSPRALQEAVKRHNIFARVQPEQKYLIVQALQEIGEVVAMTGDGVNDAPALKKATIGIAMGQKGTDVARAAAGMVLLDDNFATIVNAIKEGRRIYDNLRQAFVFLFSFHLPIIGLAVLPLIFGHSLVFFPINIIFLELICDPAAVIGFDHEKARRGLMKEKPRPSQEPLIRLKHVGLILLKGLSILLVSFGFYYYFAVLGGDIDKGRTLAFGSLVIAQVCIIVLAREWHQIKSNIPLLVIPIFTIVFLFLVLEVVSLRNAFHLVALPLADTILMVAAPIVSSLVVKIILLFFKKRQSLYASH